jgi:hypothetical protein
MRNSLIAIIICMTVTMILAIGCSGNGNTSGSSVSTSTDIELKGFWTGTYTGAVNPGPVAIGFTNTVISWNANGTAMAADVVEYNNNANTVIIKWTSHPAFTGEYQKLTWNPEPTTTVTVQAYSEETTQAAAMNNTNTTKYPPVLMTKQ